MIPWELIETARIPGSDERLSLHRRGTEFSIRGEGFELMNSRLHGSEEALARLACEGLGPRAEPQILIGGLGMGYTLAAVLAQIGPAGRATVAELVPAVVRWNREVLGHLAGQPLADERVTVEEGDVAAVLKQSIERYDAILLDVDNGPEGLTRGQNDRIYGPVGLQAVRRALRAAGVLAIWSAAPDKVFSNRLLQAGFRVEEHRVAARGDRRGGRHVVWVGLKE